MPPSSSCGWRPSARGVAGFSGGGVAGWSDLLDVMKMEAGRLQEAIGTARIWTKHAPLEEAAHRRLAELLSSLGDSEGALTAYENFRRALKRELEIEPSPRMMKMAKRLREEIEERDSFGASLARSASVRLSDG